MNRYLIRSTGNTLTLSLLQVSPTDNLAVPSDASVLTDFGWGILAALCGIADTDPAVVHTKIIAKLTALCAAVGMTLVDQTQA